MYRLAGVLGRIVGIGLSPLTFLIGFLRGARVFHPDGHIALGTVKALSEHPAAAQEPDQERQRGESDPHDPSQHAGEPVHPLPHPPSS
jgi:hypothetical protein